MLSEALGASGMGKAKRTAFELEAMIIAEIILVGECPIGIPIVVTQAGEGWSAKAQTDDPNCAVRVAQIAGRLSEKFDIEV
jgi:hypothetical protein